MRFRVIKPFTWDGQRFERGDIADIPETHKYLPGMKQGKYLSYDASDAPATPRPDNLGGDFVQRALERQRA